MFTGIIEHMGKVKDLRRAGEGGRLVLELGPMTGEIRAGESISVEGVCLTVTELRGGQASFDISQETLKRSTLGELKIGQKVNLERSLKVGDRMGGHFVQGHVDGTGIIQKREDRPGQCTMWFSVSKELAENMIEKGSVAVDGISLTLVEVKAVGGGPATFSVALIPYTITNTTLGLKHVGDRVNIETDILGKWVRRLLVESSDRVAGPNPLTQSMDSKNTPGGLTIEYLRSKGFE